MPDDIFNYWIEDRYDNWVANKALYLHRPPERW